ncbi:MAG: hypothetical protein JW855_05370 [Gammaproteobacteria bacterium]|nr:hypothetical protein [Gammaproteobacteria bacterium]
MIHIPAETQIKATIKAGSVFYFVDESLSSDQPHYFILINKKPLTDHKLLLVCASSQIQKVKMRRKNLSITTLVEIKHNEYSDFTMDSIIDCNTVFDRTIEQLIHKLSCGELKLKSYVGEKLLEKLRFAVISSPLVDNELKKLIS